MKLVGSVAYLGDNRNECDILERKPGERSSCVRDRNTWNDDIKIE
jgi:hypothetical protein